ncbi:MAG: site-2 protease family protein [Euryarchaeota archaeon]|nr:site-2 protease family protein [Euryarchaeota archaeon]
MNSRGVLERYGISTFGPLLMVRTTRGLLLLDKLANPKKFWRVFANIGIPLTVLGMFFMLVILLIGDINVLVTQPAPAAYNAPQNVLLIPGVNQFIPLTWGLIGLIVTLVVHELSHGILSRVADIKVKSLGLLVALVPLGAFAEPDEAQLLGTDAAPGEKIATRPERLRVFSAGITANFTVALIAFLLFFGPVLSSITTVEGLGVVGVVSGSPAEKAGLQPGMVVGQIDSIKISNMGEFQAFMNTTSQGQTINIIASDQGVSRTFVVVLDKNPDYDKGFLGISGMPASELLSFLKSIPSNLNNFNGWAALAALPFIFGGFTGDIAHLYQPVGWGASLGPAFFWIANTLLWVGWINFWVGLFNCLPAVPLDGGHIFRELFKSLAEKFLRNPEDQERVTSVLVTTLGVVILASFLILIVGPYIFGAF